MLKQWQEIESSLQNVTFTDSFGIGDTRVCCSKIPIRPGSNTIDCIIPPQSFKDLEILLKMQANSFFKEFNVSVIIAEDLFRQLRTKRPDEIPFFQGLEQDTHSNIKVALTTAATSPLKFLYSGLLNVVGNRQKAIQTLGEIIPERYQMAFVYYSHYRQLFNAYHDFFVHKKSESLLLVHLIEDTEINGYCITEVNAAPETPKTMLFKSIRQIKQIVTYERDFSDDGDIMEEAFTSYHNLLRSIESLKAQTTDSQQIQQLNELKVQASRAVCNFINNPLDQNVKLVDVYGISTMVTYSKDDYFYINSRQTKTLIDRLDKSEKDERKRTLINRFKYISIIFLILSIIIKKTSTTNVIISFVLFAIFGYTFYLFWKSGGLSQKSDPYKLSIIGKLKLMLFSLFPRFSKIFFVDEEKNLRKMQAKLELRREGKAVMKKALKDTVRNIKDDFLLKISGRNDLGFDIAATLKFPNEFDGNTSNQRRIRSYRN
ncbi:hypothetical protein GPJ56_008385 [Histomonas meleagridis]|uniref:uncharacterized protein n=1 Tax=Histomonas meleagridis TaxID=135588 RepID=UPI003559A76E|nr:hypothetical protein GPJ56_008385 [Histomonas meleagridis]KAH0798921.1 hypothetical protein GO595_008312 [Histomonas meleagridis]